jgi:hypothetical protein
MLSVNCYGVTSLERQAIDTVHSLITRKLRIYLVSSAATQGGMVGMIKNHE